MSFKTRLEEILKRYNINTSTLGLKLGYGENPAKLYRLLSDDNIDDHKSPSIQIIQDILKAFPEINARWLVTGEEDILVEESRAQYGFCKECLKKEGVIEHLKKECTAKDKRILELEIKLAGAAGRAEGQTSAGKKAS